MHILPEGAALEHGLDVLLQFLCIAKSAERDSFIRLRLMPMSKCRNYQILQGIRPSIAWTRGELIASKALEGGDRLDVSVFSG